MQYIMCVHALTRNTTFDATVRDMAPPHTTLLFLLHPTSHTTRVPRSSTLRPLELRPPQNVNMVALWQTNA